MELEDKALGARATTHCGSRRLQGVRDGEEKRWEKSRDET